MVSPSKDALFRIIVPDFDQQTHHPLLNRLAWRDGKPALMIRS
jgi:hypothetical protein